MTFATSNSHLTASAQSVLQRVQTLRDQLAGLTMVSEPADQRIRTDCTALEQLLPGGGLAAGMLVEWLAAGRGSGAGSLAMVIARQAVLQQQGYLVVADRGRRFYPPAAVAWGIDPAKLIVVRTVATRSGAQAELWALNQALRCPAVSAVLVWMDQLDARALRRLQLAAETGQTLGLLVRPATVRGRPTWADAQLLVEPLSQSKEDDRLCQVTLLRQRCRAGTSTREGTSVVVEINEQQGTLSNFIGSHLEGPSQLDEIVDNVDQEARRRHESRNLRMAPRVAHPAVRRRSAGA